MCEFNSEGKLIGIRRNFYHPETNELLEPDNIVVGAKQLGHSIVEFDSEFNEVNRSTLNEPEKILALRKNHDDTQMMLVY